VIDPAFGDERPCVVGTSDLSWFHFDPPG